MQSGTIVKVAGPLVIAQGLTGSRMFDLVRVGADGLMGEIIEMRGDRASIQVYEETQGIGPGDPVEPTGAPLSVELGPGMLGTVYDGVQRPLEAIEALAGEFLHRGVDAPGLDREKQWEFVAIAEVGTQVTGGQIIGTVQENEVIEHRIMTEPHVAGELIALTGGTYTVTDTIGQVRAADGTIHDLRMMQTWPVRTPRPRKEKLNATEPLTSGTRVIDTMFPLVKGGAACIPGPFGAGKTVTQHQIAKWANAQVVIFIGCGERGNEITDVLMEFPELDDPYSGQPLMRRTILVANTSNMPVAAREASVYTGITMAEYFRDMGYEVVLQADSTSRWAEAMREISGRLEEMPGDEGYPAYLGTRLAMFYERAGKVIALGGDEGSVSVVGSVSPPGGDLSEPVVQNTLRVVKTFWALQDTLAFQRHFPAIDWLTSYSLYLDKIEEYWDEHISRDFRPRRDRVMQILQRESELDEIARLVGLDALSQEEQALMDCAKMIREDFLQQNAFRDDDQFSSLPKQNKLLEVILTFYDYALIAVEGGVRRPSLAGAPVREKITRAKYQSNDDMAIYDAIVAEIKAELSVVAGSGAGGARCAWEVQ
ncbi:MAG: V-type ATP synthase subunit A [Coriobacteriia bacterium]|nr:V-type ATP synthase subunit A [Coriobacteriia bacterium]